jgi:hypothetical protein
LYKSKIVSCDSVKALFEYSDTTYGITNGNCAVNGAVNILYKPHFEPKCDSLKYNVKKFSHPKL